MKRISVLILILTMVLSLAGCKDPLPPVTDPTEDQTAPGLLPVDAEGEAEIRKAIGLLLDRNYIVTQLAQGGQQPAASFVPKGLLDADGRQFYENAGASGDFSGYYDTAPQAYEENYARAIGVLKQYYTYDPATGKFTDFPTLEYLYNNAHSHKAIGEYIQSVLGGVGIPVKLENQEWNTFLNTRKTGDYTLARNGWVADYNDPICFLDMWTSQSGNNDVRFGRGDHADQALYTLDLTPYGYEIYVEKGTWAQTYDVLIQKIKSCPDRERRYALMHLAEDMLMDTGCILPLYFNTDLYLLDSAVEGFYTNPLGHKFFRSTTVNGDRSFLSVCLASEPDTLDPALSSTLDAGTMLSHLFAGLARWGVDAEGMPVLEPDCAVELPEGTVNPDGTVTYTYTLHPELEWSDGSALEAEDFVYSWKRAASPELGGDYGYLFDLIGRDLSGELLVSAPDARTLRVTLKGPVSYWNELLALPAFLPVSREGVEGQENWATGPDTYVSNGAYTLTGWEHHSRITLTKNPRYHQARSVTMEELRFYLSDDANNMLTNFKNGTWLLIGQVPTNELQVLKSQYPTQLRRQPQLGTYYLCWNINKSLKPD